MLSLLVYIRPTHESAQSFRPCVYGQFDIRNPWSESRASLSNRAISTVDVVTSTSLRANYSQPEIYDKTAVTDTKCKCSVISFGLH